MDSFKKNPAYKSLNNSTTRYEPSKKDEPHTATILKIIKNWF